MAERRGRWAQQGPVGRHPLVFGEPRWHLPAVRGPPGCAQWVCTLVTSLARPLQLQNLPGTPGGGLLGRAHPPPGRPVPVPWRPASQPEARLLLQNGSPWSTWVAQSVKRPTSAQVMISRFVGSSPAPGSVLTAWNLEPASGSVSPPLVRLPPAPAHALSLSRSQK